MYFPQYGICTANHVILTSLLIPQKLPTNTKTSTEGQNVSTGQNMFGFWLSCLYRVLNTRALDEAKNRW